MALELETGYSIGGGDKPLENPRFLHAGNRFPVMAVTPSSERALYPATSALKPLTGGSKWMPFENEIETVSIAEDGWATQRLEVSADGYTIGPNTDNNTHFADYSSDVDAGDFLFALKVRRISVPGIRIQIIDPTGPNHPTANFDLRDGTLSSSAHTISADIRDVGGGQYIVKVSGTLTAGTARCRIVMLDDTLAASFAGDGEQIELIDGWFHEHSATLKLDLWAAAAADVIGIAGHNLGTGMATVTFQHDSNDDATFTDIEEVTPEDNSPLMLIFSPVTSTAWQITIEGGVMPEIAFVSIGAALQFECAIHQGVTPFGDNREVIRQSNMTESGQIGGLSTIRVSLSGQFRFAPLTKGWVDANISGRNGLLQAMEREPFFVAWRPADYDDAHFCWTVGQVRGPSFDMRPSLMGWSFGVMALGYEQ